MDKFEQKLPINSTHQFGSNHIRAIFRMENIQSLIVKINGSIFVMFRELVIRFCITALEQILPFDSIFLIFFQLGNGNICCAYCLYLALLFGGIALATAPAPSLSIVNEFRASGPVTKTLTSGVTKRSNMAGTILCSRFSKKHMTHTAMMTGITWPW